MKSFDVCLMPFAMNDATEFINPTKALEYMATGRPIVSTPVRDVVRQFSDIATIALGRGEFVQACSDILARPDQARIERGLALAERSSWESIVGQLEEHVSEALAAPRVLTRSAA